MGNGVIEVTGKTGKEYTRSGYSQYIEKNDAQVYDDKLRAAGNLNEAVRASTDYVNEEIKHPRKDNIREFARGRVLMRIGQNDYNAEVVVGYTKNGEMLLYDIVNFKPDTFSVKERTSRQPGRGEAGMTGDYGKSSKVEGPIKSGPATTDNSISQNNAAVNSQYTQEKENDAADTAEVGAGEGDFAVDREGSEASAAFSDEALGREGYTPTEQTRVIAMNEATRTGRKYGASPAQQAAAEELSHILGRRIVFFRSDDPTVNGYYKNGTIHVNAASGRTVASIIASEMTHAIETTSDYGALRELALRELSREKGMSLDELRAQKKETYAAHGENLDADGVDFELCEEYVGRYLFGDVAQIRAAVDYKPSLGRKIIAFLDEIIRRLTGRVRAVSSRILKDAQYARELWGRAVREVEARGAESAETKFSFAGEKSATADMSLLRKAMQLDEEGQSSEDIRRETGWFKGYDGKWRYEIDDLDAHLIENPKLERHTDGEEVYFTGKLSDILDHGELFTAYPELRSINVIIQSTEPGVEGIYQRNSNYITLSTELFKRYTKEYTDYLEGGRKAEIERIEQTPEYREYNKFFEDDAYGDMDAAEWLKLEKAAMNKFFSSDIGKRYQELVWGNGGFTGRKFELGWSKNAKAVLMHELQHAIQGIEGFAGGSSARYWSGEIENAESEYRRTQSEFEKRLDGFVDVLYRYGFTDEDFEKIDITTESGIEEAKRFLQKAGAPRGALELADSLGEYSTSRNKAFAYYLRLKNNTASDLYNSTAGEVEARDASGRSEYTAEQRKNTRPDIDRSDVVFANDGVSYALAPNAEANVDRALSDKDYTEDVYLTENSPAVIASQKGARNLPMLMKASHIRENIYTEAEAKRLGLKVNKYINYHGLGKELFLKIIGGLDDVTLAYRGTKNASDPARHENYFLLISQYKDTNGNTVNIPVYINEKGQHNEVFIDTNKIATVFGRDDMNRYIDRELRAGNLVRIKNRNTQASELTSPINASYNENASADITISQNDQFVNSSISENEKNDTRYSIEDSGWDAYHRRNQEELESNTAAAERARREERAEERAAAEEEARDRLDTLAGGGAPEDVLYDSAQTERGNIERENVRPREATMTQEEYESIIGKPLTEEEAADLREEISKAAGSIAAEEGLYSAAEEERLFLEEERTTVAPKWFEQVKKSGEKRQALHT